MSFPFKISCLMNFFVIMVPVIKSLRYRHISTLQKFCLINRKIVSL
jgi:hypothetical protein